MCVKTREAVPSWGTPGAVRTGPLRGSLAPSCKLRVGSRMGSLHPGSAPHLLAVLGVGEVDEVIIVHLLGVDDVAVLLLAQVFGVDAIGPQKLLVGHAEGLPDGLGYQLGLQARAGCRDRCRAEATWAAGELGCGRAGCRRTL